MPEKDIPEIEGLDVASGLQYTGTLDIYYKVLAEFAGGIEKRAEALRAAGISGDCERCRSEAHALKSNARTIGANTLSHMAEEMEIAGRESNVEYIRSSISALLGEYEKYIPILAPYRKKAMPAQGVKEYDSVALMELCTRILTALEDFDIDRAEELQREFYDFKVADSAREKIELLRQAIESYSYGDAGRITQQLISEV